MPFEFTPSIHLDQFEEFEEEKQVEEVAQVHEACCYDDDSLCLDELIRDDLVPHTPPVEQVESCCENGCDDDESLLFDKQFEDEFTKFCEKIYVDEHTISSNHVEKMEHIGQNCEDGCNDDEFCFLINNLRINSLCEDISSEE